MKKSYLLLPLFISLLFFACNKDEDIAKEYSKDCNLNSIEFVQLADGVKMNQEAQTISLAISRECPESIELKTTLPLGAKITEVSNGIELQSDSTILVHLKKSEEFFVITAEDNEFSEKYTLQIDSDKTDDALHIIEQIFQKDGAFRWEHVKNENGHVVKSKLINIDNELNLKLYQHSVNSNGFVTVTKFTNHLHEKYSYTWMYENEKLIGYSVQYFNRPSKNYFVTQNDSNLITSIIEKNNYDYVLNEETFQYNETGLISVHKSINLTYDEIFEYDDRKRVTSDGNYSYEYDDRGNINKRTNLRDATIYTMEYNEEGKVISKNEFVEGNIQSEIVFSYDINGKIASKTLTKSNSTKSNWDYQNSGAYLYQYDSGLINSNERIIINEKYDENHLLIESYKDQQVSDQDYFNYLYTKKYEYNDNGLIEKYTKTLDNKDGNPETTTITTYTYNNHLISESLTMTEGVVETKSTREYDANGLLVLNKYFNTEGDVKYTYSYTYGSFGKVLSRKYHSNRSNFRDERTYTYSSSWKLTSETSKYYSMDILSYEAYYEYNEYGLTYKYSKEKTYSPEGDLLQCVETEYDDEGNKISEIKYDGEGNVVSSQTFASNPGISAPFQDDLELESML